MQSYIWCWDSIWLVESMKYEDNIYTQLNTALNPLTLVSDQDGISPYYIYTISCRQVMRMRKNINYGITNWSDTKFSKIT